MARATDSPATGPFQRNEPINQTVEHQTEIAWISDLFNAFDDEVVILDATGRILAANRAWERFLVENGGSAEKCSIGSNYVNVCETAEGTGSAEARIIPDGFEKTWRSGETFRCEYPCDSPTEKRWFELTANRFQTGGNTYLIVQHRNITRRKRESADIEQAHITSNAMAALVATTADAILSYDLDGRIIIWNQSAERLYGYGRDEALGQSIEFLYPADWPKSMAYYRDEILAGRLSDFEAIRIAKDGSARDVWISCAPIRSADGEVVAISNIHRDVTDIRNAERARDLVANEVIHRAKNMLSVVTAIQRQTARKAETLADFTQSFEARLASLARSTDLLVHNAWTSVSLQDLIARHLEPFVVAATDERIHVAGPQVQLQPDCVQTVGMAIHELATNSAKYGALKQNRGRIDIFWTIEHAGADLGLTWQETGIVVEEKPAGKGFGNTVLTAHAQTVLDARASYELTSDQVRWSVLVPPVHFHTG